MIDFSLPIYRFISRPNFNLILICHKETGEAWGVNGKGNITEISQRFHAAKINLLLEDGRFIESTYKHYLARCI